MIYIKNTDTKEIITMEATKQEFNDAKARQLANNTPYPYIIATASDITKYQNSLLLLEQNKAQELFLQNKQKILDNINSMLNDKLNKLSSLGDFMSIMLVDKCNPTQENTDKLQTLYDSTKSIKIAFDILFASITNATKQNDIDVAIETFNNI